MKEYNKEKLNEYSKELFALCLEKGVYFEADNFKFRLTFLPESRRVYSFLCENKFNKKTQYTMPIWELIEKVKAL